MVGIFMGVVVLSVAAFWWYSKEKETQNNFLQDREAKAAALYPFLSLDDIPERKYIDASGSSAKHGDNTNESKPQSFASSNVGRDSYKKIFEFRQEHQLQH
ncbi:MAG: hypothetical protein LRY49_03640 [Burkholderiaceae bacterium]|nr:hypothetical protein [Burkholderiaceae bacterium]